MPKKDKIEEFSIKEFQKLIDEVYRLESGFSTFQDLPKNMQSLNDQIKKIKGKLDVYKDTGKAVQNLTEKVIKINEDLSYIKKEIDLIKKDIILSQERIEQTIKTQEEIIMDMINRFNEELLNHKNTVLEDIQKLKTQQDVLKISNTVNDKKLIAKMEDIVLTAINHKLEGKENEILMKIWLTDLKEIILNFEKLKTLKPKEFSIKLDEISEILEIYKQKLQNY
ncbi:MAG: hypothetical protein EAX89_09725 [Candidatus Lokiarchaeota archaeon]|nr:hypothetical protein [Candidatus Lokiarchaeota archaeon]